MTARRAVRLAVDAALFALLLFLMSYPLTRGLLRHGVCGCLMLGLVAVHQLLNLGWYRSLPRGRWNARRAIVTAADTGLILASTALVASSLAMAGEVFAFAPFPMTYWGRGLHHAATAWIFVLVGVHLGLHGDSLWHAAIRAAGRAWPVVSGLLLAAGLLAFIDSGMGSDMLMSDDPRPRPDGMPSFLLRHAGTLLLFGLAARLLLQGFSRKRPSPASRGA